jgi:glucose dehydrogenase
VANLSKIASRLDAFMDLMGPVIGVMLLAVGIETYRNGGSMGWPIAGAVLLVINLRVGWRRLARRRNPTPSP